MHRPASEVKGSSESLMIFFVNVYFLSVRVYEVIHNQTRVSFALKTMPSDAANRKEVTIYDQLRRFTNNFERQSASHDENFFCRTYPDGSFPGLQYLVRCHDWKEKNDTILLFLDYANSGVLHIPLAPEAPIPVSLCLFYSP
jgi:hypothetical protein